MKYSSFGMPCCDWYLSFKFLVSQICQVKKYSVGEVIHTRRWGSWVKVEYFSHNFLVNLFVLVLSVMLSMQKSTATLFPWNLFCPMSMRTLSRNYRRHNLWRAVTTAVHLEWTSASPDAHWIIHSHFASCLHISHISKSKNNSVVFM